LQQGRDLGDSPLPGRSARYRLDHIQPRSLSERLKTREEEKFVPNDRTTHVRTELVQAQLRFFSSIEEIARVEFVVAEILEQRSMKIVAARLRDQVDLAAGAGSVFGRVEGGIDTKFLNRLHAVLQPELR